MTRFEALLGAVTLLGFGYLTYDYSSNRPSTETFQGLRGTVKIDGRPLARGAVRFIALDCGQVCSAGGYIRDGRYEVPAEYGLPQGKFQVEITSVGEGDLERVLAAQARGEVVGDIQEEIPERYNRKTQIQLDLSSGSVLEADFDLK